MLAVTIHAKEQIAVPKRIVLAYSGGLDTSAIVPWLVERYRCEVVAFAADVGQAAAELEGIEAKAIASGAVDCRVVDLREVFAREFVLAALRMGIRYEGAYLLGTAIARPAIARAQVAVAREVGADAVAHGCTGKGNDQVRFEHAYAALAPELEVVAPWRLWKMVSRRELLAYLAERDIPCDASAEKPWSRDANLWHVSHEGGALEDPWAAPPDDVWTRTASIDAAPDAPRDVHLAFEAGAPVAVDGARLGIVDLVATLNAAAGAHGIGRVDLVESRVVGMKSRGCYETPGGTVIVAALEALERLVLDRDLLRFRQELALRASHVLYEGRWFTPLREALDAAARSIAEPVTGEIVVRLHKGAAVARQVRSPNALHSAALASFEAAGGYDQRDAGGFLRLFTLADRTRAETRRDRG